MPPLENKISEAILNRIRAYRLASSRASTNALLGAPMKSDGRATLREAKFGDFDRVYSMSQRLGQGPDSLENWKRLWQCNPALIDGNANRCIGWVLETSGEIVGFLGSIPLLYEYGEDTLSAAATCRFAVEPAYRSLSHLLITSFVRQKGVDLFLNTSATVAAGRMMTALKATPVPQTGYGTVLFWVLNPRQFMKAVFRKVGLDSGIATMGSTALSLALNSEMIIRRRLPKINSGSYEVVQTDVGNLSDQFQQLWVDQSRGTKRLFARRTPAIMRWHFEPPNNRHKTQVLHCHSVNRLMGYTIVRHEASSKEGLRRSIIADLLVRDNDPGVLKQLFLAAHESARNAGSHVLEIMGFSKSIRQILLKWKPYSREYPACPFFFKARDKALHEKLADEDAWYASPFDGDSTLWP